MVMVLQYRGRGSLKRVHSYLTSPRWGCSVGSLLQDCRTLQADLNSLDLPTQQSEDQWRDKMYISNGFMY